MKKIITMLLIAGIMEASIAEAATINSCVVSDFENSIIRVEGTTDGEENVTVAVMSKGTVLEIGMYYSDTVSVQNATVEDGKFWTEFKFPADEGMYSVKATNSEVMEFEWIDKASVLEFVDKLGKGEVSKDGMFEELARYGSSVGIDVSFAESKEEKDYLVENITDYAARIKDGKIDGVKNIVNLTRAELEFMEKLSETEVASVVNKLIGEYFETAEIDVTKYNKLSDTQKMKLCTGFIGEEYSDMVDFRKDFKEKVESAGKQNTTNGGGGSSGGGGLKPSGTGLPIQTTTGQYTDTESGKNERLFDIFTDVEDVSWAWKSILYAYDNGIMSGMGDNQFAPNNNITREQFAKIITVAFDKYDKNSVADFSDIAADSWATSYVASAKNSGLMKGISDTEFGYGKSLTRQDICVVIYRAAKNAGMIFEKQKTDFSDYSEISDYAKEAVSYLAGSGIISGMGDGKFSPAEYTTRAQAAKLIYAVLGGNV